MAAPILLNKHLKVLSYNGGHLSMDGMGNPDTWVHNAMDTSDKTHRSARSGCDLVLHCPMPEEDHLELTHFIIRGPKKGTHPIKSGLVWVSDEEPNIHNYTDQYVDMGGRGTMEYRQDPDQQKPVLAFETRAEDEMELVHEFSEWPAGRFIHIKFLDAHGEEAKTRLEVQFCGLVGFLGGGQKYRKIGKVPDSLNAVRRVKEICSPLHTDFKDVLDSQPCCLIISESSDKDRNEKWKKMAVDVANNKKLTSPLQFFMWSEAQRKAARPDDVRFFEGIEYDFKATLTPPTAVILDRHQGLCYRLGLDVPDVNPDNLLGLCTAWANGTLPQWKGSAFTPDEDRDSDFPDTVQVVASSIESICMDKHRDVMLYVHSSPEDYSASDHAEDQKELDDGLGPKGPPPGHRSIISSLHKVATIAKDTEGLIVAHINQHHNWVPKDFISPNGCLVFLPKNKSKRTIVPFQEPNRRPTQPSDLLDHLIQNFPGYQDTFQPVMEKAKRTEDAILAYRNIPLDGGKVYSLDGLVSSMAHPLEDTLSKELKWTQHADSTNTALVSKPAKSFSYSVSVEMELAHTSADGELICVDWNQNNDYIGIGGTEGKVAIVRLGGDPKREVCSNNGTQTLFEAMDPVDVLMLAWGHHTQRLAIVDSSWTITIYGEKDDRHWDVVDYFGRQDAEPLSICFSPDDTALAVAFGDGYLMMKNVCPGHQPLGEDWTSTAIRGVRHLKWSPDSKTLLLGLENQIETFNTQQRKFGQPIKLYFGDIPVLTCGQTLSADSNRIVGVSWHTKGRGKGLHELPCLAIVFKSGICQMMQNELDPKPIRFSTHLEATCSAWNPTGTYLAVGGKDSATMINTVKLFSIHGTLRGQIEVPGDQSISHVRWQDSGTRLVILSGGKAYIVQVTGKLRRVAPTTYEASLEPFQVVPVAKAHPNKLKGLPPKSNHEKVYDNLLTFDLVGSVLTEEQIAEYFTAMDAEGNGWVDKDEFKELCYDLTNVSLAGDHAKIDAMVDSHCTLGDKRLSYDEVAIVLLKITQQ